MASPQPPNPTQQQDETDHAWQQVISRFDNLALYLTQQWDSGELSETQEAESNALMAEMAERMDDMSQRVAETIANLEARIAEKAEMIVLDGMIVGFLLKEGRGRDN